MVCAHSTTERVCGYGALEQFIALSVDREGKDRRKHAERRCEVALAWPGACEA